MRRWRSRTSACEFCTRRATRRDRCAFSSALFQRGIGRTDLPGGDTQKIVFSIRNVLYRLPPKTVVYPGHGPSTTIEEEMLLNPFVPADR